MCAPQTKIFINVWKNFFAPSALFHLLIMPQKTPFYVTCWKVNDVTEIYISKWLQKTYYRYVRSGPAEAGGHDHLSSFCRYRKENRTEAEIDNPQPPSQMFWPSATSVCRPIKIARKKYWHFAEEVTIKIFF
jgi:hypothetical protein